MTKTRRKLKALGCHVYAGGHTVGVRAAGFEVTTHLEEGTFGAESSRRNLGVEVRVGVGNWKAEEFADKVDWLYGNPPCAAWSHAGSRPGGASNQRNVDRGKTDARIDCTRRLFDLIPVIRPTVFSWESVAAATTRGAEFVEERSRFCCDLGYDVHAILLDGVDVGLPSHRRRFFFVASRVRFEPALVPVPHVTVRQALAGIDPGPLPPETPTSRMEASLLRRVPEGKKIVLQQVYDELYPGRHDHRPGFVRARIAWDEPAPTVLPVNLYHPSEPRLLTVPEGAALLGYPPGYEFVGAATNRREQVAKAVSPTVARWLGDQVRRALERGELVAGGAETLHDFMRR